MDNREIDLFSVIILHYNQLKYINEALESVLSQDYGNIELIIADDATPDLDVMCIQSYIEERKTSRISNVKYQILRENQGTVRNVNNALRAATGKYAMFFAADDSLYDSHVLTNFVNALSALPPNQYIVAAQCAMMDEMMNEKLGDFVNVSLAVNMNKVSPMEQYRIFALSCFYAMGATAFRTDMIKERGLFDETYKIIEDWSYYLSLTFGGSKVMYSDFNALKHRDGGVSHFNSEILPPHVVEYKNDSLVIQEKLILPHLSTFPLSDQVRLLARYEQERKGFATLFTDKLRPSRMHIILQHKKLYARKMVWWIMERNASFKQKCIYWAKRLLPAWAIMCIVRNIIAAFISDKQLLLINMQVYDIITYLILGLFIADIVFLVCTALMSMVFFLRRKKKELFSRNQ